MTRNAQRAYEKQKEGYMNKIRKAVIPAAGFGTRFLPATKAIPKEMLPIVDTPTLQYVVEEAVKSGIKEILIIINILYFMHFVNKIVNFLHLP